MTTIDTQLMSATIVTTILENVRLRRVDIPAARAAILADPDPFMPPFRACRKVELWPACPDCGGFAATVDCICYTDDPTVSEDYDAYDQEYREGICPSCARESLLMPGGLCFSCFWAL